MEAKALVETVEANIEIAAERSITKLQSVREEWVTPTSVAPWFGVWL